MALTFNGTSSTVTNASKSVGSFLPSAYPFTLFCWAKATATLKAGNLVYFQADAADTGASAHYVGVRSNPATTLQYFSSTGSAITLNASQAVSAGTWYPVMLVCNSATSRTLYYGTGAALTDTASSTPTLSAVGWTKIGDAAWKGDIACVGVWDSALTLSDFQTLGGSAGGGSGGGVVPSTVSSGTLREYWSLLTQASTHTGINGRVLTATSTSQAADHPITESGGGSSLLPRALLLGVG